MPKIFRLSKNNRIADWLSIESGRSELISDRSLTLSYDDSTVIWRYLDFTKFVSLLHSESLFFTRLDSFFDKYEGDYLPGDLSEIFSTYDPNRLLDSELKKRIIRISRMGSFANCWHINERENYGMWKSYVRTEEGVAIQSTVKSLKKALGQQPENLPTIIDKVIYVDYSKINSARILMKEHANNGISITPLPAFLKNYQYEFEKELRAVVHFELSLPPVDDLDQNKLSKIEAAADPYVIAKVDLNELIENVFVHPSAPRWFSGLVKDVMERYLFNKPVIHSFLSNPR